MIALHCAPRPNGWKISIMREELGVPYKVIPVNIRAGDQFKPEFLAISPNTRIPAIVDRANPVVRADREKFRLELVAGPDVDGNDLIGDAELLPHDRDFPAVRPRRAMKGDHGRSAIMVPLP